MRVVIAALVMIVLAAVALASSAFAIEEHSIIIDGETRSYLLHVPRSINPNAPTPLILALHGGGGSMHHMSKDRRYGLISKANEARFIVVFPNGYSRLPGGRFATWNAGRCCAAARDDNSSDVAFLKAVVTDVAKRQLVDKRRVYAIGMSNGALMAYRLACEAPDVFSGILAVAGTDNTENCSPDRAVSVLHVHARDDDHVLFNGGAGKTFRKPSTVTDFTSVPATVTKWVKLNRCAVRPQRTLSVPGAACDTYADCAGGAAVRLCVTEAGGHSWPGGKKPFADQPSSQAINANDEMWKFFSR